MEEVVDNCEWNICFAIFLNWFFSQRKAFFVFFSLVELFCTIFIYKYL
jgi:hypothetical protein